MGLYHWTPFVPRAISVLVRLKAVLSEEIGAIKLITKKEPIALNTIHEIEGDKKGIFKYATMA